MELNEEIIMKFEESYKIHLCPKNFPLHYTYNLLLPANHDRAHRSACEGRINPQFGLFIILADASDPHTRWT